MSLLLPRRATHGGRRLRVDHGSGETEAVYYIDFLARLHEQLKPRTYLEIGVRNGHSLALSHCRSVGIDPDFQVNQGLPGAVSLIRSTSDDFFADLEGVDETSFQGLPVDLAFIDGMHLFEYALRDFANVERYVGPASVIAFDDMFPCNIDEAARDRHTQSWTGDVFRVMLALQRQRPDLRQVRVDTEPTGLLLITGFSSEKRLVADAVESIVTSDLQQDPQTIPDEVLERYGALDPDAALTLPLWNDLRASRDRHQRRPGRFWARRS